MRKPKSPRAKDATPPVYTLQDYPAEFRDALAALIERNKALADLKRSFPALLIKITTLPDTAPERQAAVEQICDGASAYEVAGQMALARWTARLHPNSLVPSRVHALPDDPRLNSQIGNYVPADPAIQGAWLDAVIAGCESGGRVFTLWLARCMDSGMPFPAARSIQFVAFYHRASLMPETRLARIMQTRWHPDQSFEDAFVSAQQWLLWVIVHALFGATGQSKTWRTDGEAYGYRFRALRTAEDFKSAAEASNNCLYRYTETLLTEGGPRVFNIEHVASNQLVGHVEIGFDAVSGMFVRPMQIRGDSNQPLDEHLHRAIYQWLAEAHTGGAVPVPPSRRQASVPRPQRIRLPSIWDEHVCENWRELLEPYINQYGHPFGFEPAPTWTDIDALHAALVEQRNEADARIDVFARDIQRRIDRMVERNRALLTRMTPNSAD